MVALLVKPDSRPPRGASHHFWYHIANPQPGSMPLAGCGKIYLFMKSLSVLCAKLASLSVISPSGADYREGKQGAEDLFPPARRSSRFFPCGRLFRRVLRDRVVHYGPRAGHSHPDSVRNGLESAAYWWLILQ